MAGRHPASGAEREVRTSRPGQRPCGRHVRHLRKGRARAGPHTGRPATGWISFTVVGPDIVEADVYATACFAMGGEGLEFVSRTAGYEAYAVDRRLQASYTTGFDALCETFPATG